MGCPSVPGPLQVSLPLDQQPLQQLESPPAGGNPPRWHSCSPGPSLAGGSSPLLMQQPSGCSGSSSTPCSPTAVSLQPGGHSTSLLRRRGSLPPLRGVADESLSGGELQHLRSPTSSSPQQLSLPSSSSIRANTRVLHAPLQPQCLSGGGNSGLEQRWESLDATHKQPACDAGPAILRASQHTASLSHSCAQQSFLIAGPTEAVAAASGQLTAVRHAQAREHR